jgi:hypothetical protein
VPTSTDLVKDGATAIEALGDGIDTSMVDLKGGLTGQVLAKATNADMDFSWVTTDDTNAIQNAIVDAKGDLIAASAADTPARLAVGTDGQVLTASSGAATGLAWANAGGMTLISTTTLSGASVVLSSIPQTYTSLYLLIYGMANATADGKLQIKPNGTSNSMIVNGVENATVYSVTSATGTSDFTRGNINRSGGDNTWVVKYDFYIGGAIYRPVTASYNYAPTSGDYIAGSMSGGLYNLAAFDSITISNSGGNFSGGTVKLYGVR